VQELIILIEISVPLSITSIFTIVDLIAF